MRSSRRSPRLALATALSAGLALAGTGCLSSSSSDTVTGTTPTNAALVRVVQAMSDTSVTFSFGTSGATAAVPFGAYVPASGQPCSQYVNYCVLTSVGAPTLAATATGATAPFYTQTASSITNNGAFTVIALGHVASGATPAATVAVIADTAGVTSSTNALIRVFNALDYVRSSATGTSVDVYIYPQGGARPASPDTSLRALAWNSRSAYVSKTPASLVVDVFAAGAPSAGTPLFSTTLGTLSANTIRTLVLRNPAAGAAAGTPGSVITLNDQY